MPKLHRLKWIQKLKPISYNIANRMYFATSKKNKLKKKASGIDLSEKLNRIFYSEQRKDGSKRSCGKR